jgi:hypothetical protein
MATYDGSRLASGVRIYVDGEPEKITVLVDALNQSFKSAEPFRIGAGEGPQSRFEGDIDDVCVYNLGLSSEDVELSASNESINSIAALPLSKRTEQQSRKIQGCFLDKYAPKPMQEARLELVSLRREREHLIDTLPTTMVMEDMKTPRETHLWFGAPMINLRESTSWSACEPSALPECDKTNSTGICQMAGGSLQSP